MDVILATNCDRHVICHRSTRDLTLSSLTSILLTNTLLPHHAESGPSSSLPSSLALPAVLALVQSILTAPQKSDQSHRAWTLGIPRPYYREVGFFLSNATIQIVVLGIVVQSSRRSPKLDSVLLPPFPHCPYLLVPAAPWLAHSSRRF